MARQAKADGNRKTRQTRRRGEKAGAPRPRRISPLRKPQDMTLEQWQIALRRQSAKDQRFRVENIGKESIFSEFSRTPRPWSSVSGLRTHEILEGRLGRRGYHYVLFHGGIPGRQRKDLIGQFKTDPDCRLFLSTDAGGVGLNLQNASVVVNMDLPWNPAVLEQRIGRVHRLGQHRPVRVVNFVAQGTIEHGMLSLLAFKKSLFSGVLDDGQGEVFLGGTRLKRFMEGVEKVTGAIPEPMPQQEQTVRDTQEAGQEVGEQAEPAEPTGKSAAAQRPFAPVVEDLLTTGLSFLEKLSQVITNQGQAGSGPSQPLAVETDQATGKRYLKLPMPDTDVLQRITSAMGDVLKRLGG